MSAATRPPQAAEAAPPSGQPWQLGPPPDSPDTAPGPRLGLPFSRAPRSRRAAYRIGVARRVIAAVLAGVALWTALRVLAPPPPPEQVHAVLATRDLAAGTVLGAGDLTIVPRPVAELPAAFVPDPNPLVGQALAGPVTAGEVLTSVRLRGRGLLTGQPPGEVAVGVPLADGTLVPSLHVGDSVSVLAAGVTDEVTRGTVLAVNTEDAGSLTSRRSGAASVVLAVPSKGAAALAAGMGGPSAGFVLALHR